MRRHDFSRGKIYHTLAYIESFELFNTTLTG